MEPHPDYESLSAYLDGEARDEEQARRLIQQNEHAARTAVQYQKIGAHLKAMKGPVPPSDFADRVLARLDEAALPARVTPFRRPLRLAAGFAALAASIAAVVGLQPFFFQAEPPAAARTMAPAPTQEERLAAAVELLPAEDLEFVFVTEPSEEAAAQGEVAVDALVASLVTESLLGTPEESGDPGSVSWYDDLETLGEDETEAFTALLIQYGGEV